VDLPVWPFHRLWVGCCQLGVAPVQSSQGVLNSSLILRKKISTHKLELRGDTPQYQTHAPGRHKLHPLCFVRRIARRKIQRPVYTSGLGVAVIHDVVDVACLLLGLIILSEPSYAYPSHDQLIHRHIARVLVVSPYYPTPNHSFISLTYHTITTK
jgi:hypothetical protein